MVRVVLALLLFLFLQSCQTEQAPVTNQPNIVFILADDLGWSQIGCYGSDYYKTPNIDQIAQEGMKFTQAYAAAAVCSPTRASIMTGKYPARLHLTDFIAGNNKTDYPLLQPDWQKFLPLDEVTFAELLQEKGYKMAHFGKWHLSPDKTPPESLPYNPDKQGFDQDFVTYKPSGNLAQIWQQAENDAHNVDTLTQLSLEFIDQHQDQQFFLFVSHNTIHDPLKEKEKLVTKYDTLPASDKGQNHPVIAAMIERLDQSVGKIMQKLEEYGLSQNTILIFFSDNGGKHAYAAQTPLKMGKGWLYEGGIRVPLVIRWPAGIEPGTVRDDLVSSIDLFPTFLGLSGLSVPDSLQVDGKNLVPVLQGNSINSERLLFWHYPHYHRGSGMVPAGAVRQGDYKLIEWYEPLLMDQPGKLELYDLSRDPGETNDLKAQLPEVARSLQQKLHLWREETGAQMPALNANL